MMQYGLIIIYLFILPATFIVLLWKILNIAEDLKASEELRTLNAQKEEKNTIKLRKHSSIGKSNYDSSFGGRKAYEIYKNTNGLYEPVTPSKGIDLKKKEE